MCYFFLFNYKIVILGNIHPRGLEARPLKKRNNDGPPHVVFTESFVMEVERRFGSRLRARLRTPQDSERANWLE